MKNLTTSAAFFALAMATPAVAATDGTLGPSSTGTFTIGAIISPANVNRVRVYGLEDYSFSLIEGDQPDGQSKSLCITRENGGGDVGVTVSSFDAADTYFRATTPGGADEIQFLLFLNAGDGSDQLTEGNEVVFTNIPETCEDGVSNSANLGVTPITAHLSPPGNYSGSFLLTVAPK